MPAGAEEELAAALETDELPAGEVVDAGVLVPDDSAPEDPVELDAAPPVVLAAVAPEVMVMELELALASELEDDAGALVAAAVEAQDAAVGRLLL